MSTSIARGGTVYAPHFHPRQALVLGLAALFAALVFFAAALPDLAGLELPLGGGGTEAGTPATATAPAEPARIADPMASPAERLTGGR